MGTIDNLNGLLTLCTSFTHPKNAKKLGTIDNLNGLLTREKSKNSEYHLTKLGTIDNLNGLLTIHDLGEVGSIYKVRNNIQPKWFTHDEQNC